MYPGLRSGLEDLIEEFTSHVTQLRALEVDRTLPVPKQKSQAKSALQRKRHALADYFKALSELGLSHRKGSLAWKNRVDEVLDFAIAPLELRAALGKGVGPVERRTLEQWDGCERCVLVPFRLGNMRVEYIKLVGCTESGSSAF